MLGFNHTLAGCITAVVVPAPFVPAVAFISHFILDMTPHFGQSQNVKPYTKSFKWLLVVDALLCTSSLALGIFLFPDMWFILAVGAFFSTLPDFMWLLVGKATFLKGFFSFASAIQWGERPYGWVFDIFYGILFVGVLFWLAQFS